MNDYQFQMVQHGKLVGEGYGSGANAIEAFENAIASNTAILPRGEPVTVIATDFKGLAISFEANQL